MMNAPLLADDALAGRRELALLAYPSVRHMADTLASRCRERSWIRTSVASLERFRAMTGCHDLEALLAEARQRPAVAQEALAAFAATMAGYAESQIAGLAMGPKLWFGLNGVDMPWRPLPGAASPLPLIAGGRHAVDGMILLALIGSGLYRAELLRLSVGDVGSLDAAGRLVPDIRAEPLAVRYVPRRGQGGERITFLTFQARQALLADLKRREALGQPTRLDAPLIANADGTRATAGSAAGARRRNLSLIRAGSNVNVELCLTTGNFFRAWGLPGSRFAGDDDLNIEDFI